jgi:hypothetical protein
MSRCGSYTHLRENLAPKSSSACADRTVLRGLVVDLLVAMGQGLPEELPQSWVALGTRASMGSLRKIGC